jgi:hypothetical protein
MQPFSVDWIFLLREFNQRVGEIYVLFISSLSSGTAESERSFFVASAYPPDEPKISEQETI